MKTLFLRRISQTWDDSVTDATFGTLIDDHYPICVTLEPLKCIPAGTYRCVRDYTGKHRHYRVLDVDGFTDVELHPGNSARDTIACIILGLYFDYFNIEVRQSGEAFKQFHRIMKDEEEFKLIIEECWL